MAFALTIPFSVNAQQFYCTIQSDVGFMPSEFLIDYAGNSATVTHGWIDQPSVRQVQVRGNGNRRVMGYIIPDVSGFGSLRATLRFSLRHTTSSNALRVTIDPVEYQNVFSGSGACSQVQ